MSQSRIEWTEQTWNPIVGCSKISPGCANCYAERMAGRLAAMGKRQYYGLLDDGHWWGAVRPTGNDAPLRRKTPTTYFVCSMSDLFHENVPDKWLNDLFSNVMEIAQHHTFLLLTKRAKRMQEYLSWRWGGGRIPARNIWLGVTAEDQQRADERIPLLLQTPAAKRFVSVEPMLGPVDLAKWLNYDCDCGICKFCGGSPRANYVLNWVICGGESGPGARPMHPGWARSLRDQCKAAGVPFLFKQWGEWGPCKGAIPDRAYRDGPGLEAVWRVGKKAAGRLLDGRLHDERPGAHQ